MARLAGRDAATAAASSCRAMQGRQMRTALVTTVQPLPERPECVGRRARLAAAGVAVVAACWLGGCCSVPKRFGDPRMVCPPERLDRGYTIILPGIFGYDPRNPCITKGLLDAGVPTAIEVYDWTRGFWYMMQNLRGVERNRRQARMLAAKIVDYQDRYPGRPVYLIGHSAGAGVAVMTLEALPADRKVAGAILLAPSLAPDYDLRQALGRTESGIHNFYSYYDAPALILLTTLLGTTEGRHTGSAGALGFWTPKGLRPEERQRYKEGVVQRKYTFDMIGTGHIGEHSGWTTPAFVAKWLAPLIACPPAEDLQMVSRPRRWTTGGMAMGQSGAVRRLPPVVSDRSYLR